MTGTPVFVSGEAARIGLPLDRDAIDALRVAYAHEQLAETRLRPDRSPPKDRRGCACCRRCRPASRYFGAKLMGSPGIHHPTAGRVRDRAVRSTDRLDRRVPRWKCHHRPSHRRHLRRCTRPPRTSATASRRRAGQRIRSHDAHACPRQHPRAEQRLRLQPDSGTSRRVRRCRHRTSSASPLGPLKRRRRRQRALTSSSPPPAHVARHRSFTGSGWRRAPS